jgi:hypothetical protein
MERFANGFARTSQALSMLLVGHTLRRGAIISPASWSTQKSRPSMGFSYHRSKALESTDERIMLPTNDGHSHLEMYKDDQSFASDDALSITINSIPSTIDLLDHSPFSKSVA